MSAATPSPELTGDPAADVPAVLAACEQRILEREGIAMFVALHDARAGHDLSVVDAVAVGEGPLLAGLFDHYASALDDESPDDDPTGAAALIRVLVVLSDQHLRSTAVTPAAP